MRSSMLHKKKEPKNFWRKCYKSRDAEASLFFTGDEPSVKKKGKKRN